MAEHANRRERLHGVGGGHVRAQHVPRCKCGWQGPVVTGKDAADNAYRAHAGLPVIYLFGTPESCPNHPHPARWMLGDRCSLCGYLGSDK